jgi:hypothetical protein
MNYCHIFLLFDKKIPTFSHFFSVKFSNSQSNVVIVVDTIINHFNRVYKILKETTSYSFLRIGLKILHDCNQRFCFYC